MSTGIFRFYVIWFCCGFLLLTFDILPPALEWANAVFLMAAGLLGGIYFYKQYGALKGLLYSGAVFVISILVEYLGVQFQGFFGNYYYNNDFGPMIGGVPITIGFAWLMVMAGAHEISSTLVRRLSFGWYAVSFVIIGGFLAISIDLILDPVAYQIKEYWVWQEDGPYYNIPLSNFTDWFYLAIFFQILALVMFQKQKPSQPVWQTRAVFVFFSITIMFTWLALLEGLYGAVMLVTSLTSLWILLYLQKRGTNDSSKEEHILGKRV
ncbi:carotenoid biosynthesis protein [Pontibacillus salicampi]|uniref:Carotenoid biosynthesis protein n=1 Tax=Pontibacillus salicampi TaxID=1449801 RepID=A0ABV6LIN1_9BACI